MCTLTWNRDELTGLEVFFNRDELKTRPVASPPEMRCEKGVRFLSPRDPRGGGTWMLANEFGVLVCLLNRWELETRMTGADRPRMSRGRLVWSMAGVRELDEIEGFLDNLESYPAFTLVGFSAEGERSWEWDGVELLEGIPLSPLTSSSYSFEAVKAAREASYRSGLRGREYHAAAHEAASAFSVRMCRPDAQTWSRSVVRIGGKVSWEYLAEQPDLDGEPERTFVELVRQ